MDTSSVQQVEMLRYLNGPLAKTVSRDLKFPNAYKDQDPVYIDRGSAHQGADVKIYINEPLQLIVIKNPPVIFMKNNTGRPDDILGNEAGRIFQEHFIPERINQDVFHLTGLQVYISEG